MLDYLRGGDLFTRLNKEVSLWRTIFLSEKISISLRSRLHGKCHLIASEITFTWLSLKLPLHTCIPLYVQYRFTPEINYLFFLRLLFLRLWKSCWNTSFLCSFLFRYSTLFVHLSRSLAKKEVMSNLVYLNLINEYDATSSTGDVHGRGCEILFGRISFGSWSFALLGNHIPRLEAWKVSSSPHSFLSRFNIIC